MSGVRARYTPAFPWVSSFPELNVRTYVLRDGKPGVWFFSLDTTNPLAMRAARWMYGLAYHSAEITMHHEGEGLYFSATGSRGKGSPREFALRYRPIGWTSPLGIPSRWAATPAPHRRLRRHTKSSVDETRGVPGVLAPPDGAEWWSRNGPERFAAKPREA